MLISPVLIDIIIERANEHATKHGSREILKKENAISIVQGAETLLQPSTFTELKSFIFRSNQFDLPEFIRYVNRLDAQQVLNFTIEQLFSWEDTIEGWEFWFELYSSTMDDTKTGPYWKGFSQADYLEIILTGDLPVDKMRATM